MWLGIYLLEREVRGIGRTAVKVYARPYINTIHDTNTLAFIYINKILLIIQTLRNTRIWRGSGLV